MQDPTSDSVTALASDNAHASDMEPPKCITTFDSAWSHYYANLPDKNKKYISDCRTAGTGMTPHDVNAIIQKAAEKKTMKTANKTILSQIVNIVKDYGDIISQFASAQPLPLAIIWGAVKMFVEGAHRYLKLSETINNALQSLSVELHRIPRYENLYYDHPDMKDYFFKSYTAMIHFWYTVNKECHRSFRRSLSRMIASAPMRKLEDIVAGVKTAAENIEKMARIVENERAQQEREKTERERVQAAHERAEAERKREQSEERHTQQQYKERYEKIRAWLSNGIQKAAKTNRRRHADNLSHWMEGTCSWLDEHDECSAWKNGTASSPVLWLHSPQGCGKSILCSRIIESIRSSNPQAAIAYHFYQFDQPKIFARDTLCLLAEQLLDCYWLGSNKMDDALADRWRHQLRDLPGIADVKTLIKHLIQTSPLTYVFLDGLDEIIMGKARWEEALQILKFLGELSKNFPTSVRICYSSQDRACIRDALASHSPLTIDITPYAKKDVIAYLFENLLDQILPAEIDREDGDENNVDLVVKISKMLLNAQGNFLWARWMVDETLKANTPRERRLIVETCLPLQMDDYYKRIFDRIEGSCRPFARKIFALIAFSRRPLRLEEVRQAVGLLESRSQTDSLKCENLPIIVNLQKIFHPLILVFSDDDGDQICCLSHASVFEFLLRHGGVLNPSDPDLRISPYVIADACLRSLSQPKYANLLSKHGTTEQWLDSSGVPVQEHRFIQYAAKYWNKHLEEVEVPECNNLLGRVEAFVDSPNFQTWIQVQCLWVDGKFDVFNVELDGKEDHCCTYLLRAFPSWFVQNSARGQDIRRCYRAFVHDWREFLSCGSCRNAEPNCAILPYRGEVDRCWWGSLCSSNFLSKFKGRYTSFRLEAPKGQRASGEYFEGFDTAGDRHRVLRFISQNEGALHFICEHWKMEPPSVPICTQQTIHTTDDATNWRFYSRAPDASTMRSMCNAAMFSPDCQFLRIGAQLFALNDQDEYHPLVGLNAQTNGYPDYFEEFARRGPFTVIASRKAVTAKDIRKWLRNLSRCPPDSTDLPGSKETTGHGVAERSDDEDDDMDSNVDSSESSSSDGDEDEEASDEEAYEDWSDGSTVQDSYPEYEDDTMTPWAGLTDDILDDSDSDDLDQSDQSDQSNQSDLSSQSTGENDDDAESEVDDRDDADEIASNLGSDPAGSDSSSSVESVLPAFAVLGQCDPGNDSEEDEDVYWEEDDDGLHCAPARYRRTSNQTQMISFSVFDTDDSSQRPKKIFQLTQPLNLMIYASPPVVHPTKALAVWPLGGGDVLFADFLNMSYFVRRLQRSAPHARNIFMKCHFSPCGQYLHIASLEGTGKPPSQPHKKRSSKPPLKLALLLSTFKLSGRKTTRSPPTLIHRVKVDLGSRESCTVSRLPYTLTWTSDELFLTCNDVMLRVYRIRLFRDPTASKQSTEDMSVLVPKKPTFLPSTAPRREVYFFPPTPGSTTACVILGCENRAPVVDQDGAVAAEPQLEDLPGDAVKWQDMSSPPIGCYLQVDADMGGWEKSDDKTDVPKYLGIGGLNHLREIFDPVDDCDVEPYIRF